MVQAVLLAFAVCMDTFFSSMGCAMNGITIPKRCALLMSAVGTIFLSISLYFAQVLNQILPENLFRYAGAGILFFSGCVQMLKEGLPEVFRKYQPNWKWTIAGLVVKIYFDETLADTDHSKTLSLTEALTFSAVLSLDSLASGIGAGIEENYHLFCLLLTFCAGFFLTCSGAALGKYCHNKKNFSWIGGIFLIILAFSRIFI